MSIITVDNFDSQSFNLEKDEKNSKFSFNSKNKTIFLHQIKKKIMKILLFYNIEKIKMSFLLSLIINQKMMI